MSSPTLLHFFSHRFDRSFLYENPTLKYPFIMTKLINYFNEYCKELDSGTPSVENEKIGEIYVRLYARYILGQEDIEKIENSIIELPTFGAVGIFDNEYENRIEVALSVEKPLFSDTLCDDYKGSYKIIS